MERQNKDGLLNDSTALGNNVDYSTRDCYN